MDKGGGTKIVLFESELEKEAAKVAGTVIGRAAGGVMDAVSDVFGGLIGDAIREWRRRNLIARLARTAEILKAKGVALDKAKALPMGEAYAMFEEASKQDDPTISDMWSALLANAMDPESSVRIDPAFVAVLRNLGGIEAHILKFVGEFDRERTRLIREWPPTSRSERDMSLAKREEVSKPAQELLTTLKEKYISAFSKEQIQIALSNLVRERCLCIPAPSYSNWDLTERASVDLGRYELVSAAKIEDALNTLSGSIDEHSGRPDMVPPLEVRHSSPVKLSYDVTEFGLRLLRACEPT